MSTHSRQNVLSEHPGGLVNWSIAAGETIIFCLIALFCIGEMPSVGERVAWTFLMTMTVFPALHVLLQIQLWNYAQSKPLPHWLRETHLETAKSAFWIAAILVFALSEEGAHSDGHSLVWLAKTSVAAVAVFAYLLITQWVIDAVLGLWKRR